MLCKFCQKIRPPHHSQRTSTKYNEKVEDHLCIVRHHASFQDLIQSALNGCELCELFRPFIENAMKEPNEDEYGAFHDDPFEDLDANIPTIRLTKDIIYEDESDCYRWLDERTDEKNDAHCKHTEETLEREEEEDRQAGLMPKRDRTDNYEIVQWLFQNPAKRTGPEQIWIRGWTHYDYEYKKGGQYEASTIFTLGAGAMELDFLDMADYELCVDGQHFSSNRTALVMEMPGLWVHRIIPLTIHREDPLSDLEPMFEFFQQRSNLKELSPPVNALDVVEDPISEACSNVARSWLSACVGSHARCKQLSGTEIPTRLIDVGATDASQRPHLEKMAANSQGIPYVILSHCWGDPSHITRLTKGNIAELMEEIDEVALSKSFQDAINITRALNIRYLWIDALCIIQDSAEDWAIESTKMAQYYRSGTVMISALASPGAGHGILHPRTGDANAVKHSLNGNELFIRPALEDAWTVIQDENHHGSDVRQDISVQPLNSRAWTLQERLFAPRIIHYSVQQLIWQCKTCIASEDNQFEFMSGGKVISPVIDMINLDTERSGKNKRPTILSTGWYNLLGGYTTRQITYSSDLLPGISGLAQEVQNLTGVKYLAGIWNGPPAILMSSLLWEVERRGGKAATRANNGSPSWSWASVRAKITHQLHEMFWIEQPDIDPKFFLYGAKLATSNPFGQVSGGKIKVSGFVHAYTGSSTFAEYQTRKLVERVTLGDEEERDSWGSKMIIYDNTEDNPIDPYTEIQKLIALGEAQKEPVVELDIPDEEYDFSKNDHILLFMSRWDQVSKSTNDLSAEQHFLLLRRVETEEGSKKALGGEKWLVFERVGIAEVGSRHMLDISESEGWERRNAIIV